MEKGRGRQKNIKVIEAESPVEFRLVGQKIFAKSEGAKKGRRAAKRLFLKAFRVFLRSVGERYSTLTRTLSTTRISQGTASRHPLRNRSEASRQKAKIA